VSRRPKATATAEPTIEASDAPPPRLRIADEDLVDVRPTSGLIAGHHLRMRKPSIRWYLAHRRGFGADQMAEVWYEEIADAIEEHDLGRDPLTLPAKYILAIGQEWMAAATDRAVDPTTGPS
jgi:hypothetical protein